MSVNSWTFEAEPPARDLLAAIRREAGIDRVDLAVVLGSGWSEAFRDAEILAEQDYRDWACFPPGQVAGHGGRLRVVRQAGRFLLLFCGRFHGYQGLSAFAAAFPVRLASALGAPRILLTCATGGVNPRFAAGDYMLVADHLNLLGDNPLRGLAGEIFVDLCALYQTGFYDALRRRTADLPTTIHRGVLAALPGPSYETPAEIRMLAALGADVVSMSTVPEAIMARFLGMEVAAVAMIANPAAGLAESPIRHEDVLASGQSAADVSRRLLQDVIALWAGSGIDEKS